MGDERAVLSEMVIQALGEVFELAAVLEKRLPCTEGQPFFSSRHEVFICEREVRFDIHARNPQIRRVKPEQRNSRRDTDSTLFAAFPHTERRRNWSAQGVTATDIRETIALSGNPSGILQAQSSNPWESFP